MKKLYNAPMSEIVGFEVLDIITASDVSEFKLGHSGYEDEGDLNSVFNIQQ